MDATMPMFDDSMMGGGDELSHGLHGGMSLGGDDSAMTGMMDSNGGLLGHDGGDMMNGLDDLDMLPMTLDVNLDDGGDQDYSPIVGSMNNEHQQSQQSQQEQAADDDNNGIVMADNNMSGAGAGPLPTGFGAQAAVGGGSTLTEFTKRRNWSQRVLEELQDFLHILTPDGRLIYVSQSAKALTGHSPDELVNKFIMNFIHPDDSQIFMREFNESISSGNSSRFFYRFRKSDGTYTIFESHGHPHLTSDASQYSNSGGAGYCRGFFMMARPYPTKNAALLDSFLEHKIENERLTKKIADLKKEEQEELEAQQRHLQRKAEGHSSVTPSETMPTESGQTAPSTSMSPSQSHDYNSMPPPAKPNATSNQLTSDNLREANASRQPDSMIDKMARYEGATHIETIEMLTGLRYREGERSQGISTGDASPNLIRGEARGDVGIPVPIDKENRGGSGDKKKKAKMADEYVCTDCGTLDSPEWRKGPQGPKTLCNACGLRWAKKEKKRTGPSNGHSHPGMPMHASTSSS